jgi:hypothetical protein
MAEIDEVKEILNSLRVAMSITIGLLVVIIGATIRLEQSNQINIYFYAGIVSVLVLVVAFVKIVSLIRENTKKIKDL